MNNNEMTSNIFAELVKERKYELALLNKKQVEAKVNEKKDKKLMSFLRESLARDGDVVLRQSFDIKVFVDISEEILSNPEKSYEIIKNHLISKGYLMQVSPVSTWKREVPDRKWIIDHWLPEGTVSILAGKGGVGKSSLLLQLATDICAGHNDWLKTISDKNIKTKVMEKIQLKEPATVVICSYEDEIEELSRRIRSLSKEYGFVDNIGDRLHGIDFTKMGALWAPSSQGSMHISTLAEQTSSGEWLQKYCEKVKAKLLIVDPTAAAYGSEENSRALVRAFMTFWTSWARDNSCTVLFVGHEAKAVSEDYRMSGSTDWFSSARTVLSLFEAKSKGICIQDRNLTQTKTKTKTTHFATGLRLQLIKSNYGKTGLGHWVRLLPEKQGIVVCPEFDSCYVVELGRDEIDEITDEDPFEHKPCESVEEDEGEM